MKVIEGNQYIFQYEIKGTIAKINYLGVQKRYRNKGIGKKVVKEFIEKCKKKSVEKIEIDAEPQISLGIVQDYYDGILKIQ